jgi:hypothetical protein
MLTQALLLAPALLISCDAFFVAPASSRYATTTALGMGLFDGVKEAFSTPALERSALDAERETPIDRWMGWSVVSENKEQQTPAVGMLMFDCGVACSPLYDLPVSHYVTALTS